MSRLMPEPKIYTHQNLMDRLNELMIAIKTHHHLPVNADKAIVDRLKAHRPIPSDTELNELQNKINEVLQKDAITRKY